MLSPLFSCKVCPGLDSLFFPRLVAFSWRTACLVVWRDSARVGLFSPNNTFLQQPVCHLLLSVKAPRDDVSALCSSVINVIQCKCWFSSGPTARFCVWGLVCFGSMTHSDRHNECGSARGRGAELNQRLITTTCLL